MDFKECPMYEHCQKMEDKCVLKETCNFRWNIVEKCVEDNASIISSVHDVEKDLDFIKEVEHTFTDFITSVGVRTTKIEKNIENLIIRNDASDNDKKIKDEYKKRKQNIRDTIVTGVVIAFIVGTLAGGWEMFKKVSIILENSTTVSQTVQTVTPNVKVIIPFNLEKE